MRVNCASGGYTKQANKLKIGSKFVYIAYGEHYLYPSFQCDLGCGSISFLSCHECSPLFLEIKDIIV